MAGFENIISGTTGTHCIMIYGKLDDFVCARDSVQYPFRSYLARTLRGAGFDNVVFFDASKALGKYVCDEESAYYSFSQNHGCSQEAPAGAETPDAGNLVVQSQFMEENTFYPEFVSLMQETAFRSAVVITNLLDLLEHGDLNFRRRMSEQINYILESGNMPPNLLVLLEPDIHSAQSAGLLADSLARASLRDRFMIPAGNTWVFDPERVFCFGQPCADEICALLERYRLGVGGKRLVCGDAPEKLAGRIVFYLRDGFGRERAAGRAVRPVTMHLLDRKIREYLSAEDPAPLTLQNISDISPYTTCFEKEPEGKLRNTRGWETVSGELFRRLDEFTAIYPQYAQESGQDDARSNSPIVRRLSHDTPRRYPNAAELPHIMLLGDPGVGKTEVARLIGQILRNRGLLEIGSTVEARANQIISDHVGGTAHLVTALLDRAEGGVLLIDEAYQLYQKRDGSAGNFRAEAIDVLVQALTDPNRHFLLILAGYANSAPDQTDGVEALLQMNQGLDSRIRICVNIPTFTADHLAEIAEHTLEEKGFRLGGGITHAGMVKMCERILRKRDRRNWANARSIKKIVQDEIISACSARRSKTAEPQDFPGEYRDILCGQEKSYTELLAETGKTYPGLGDIICGIASQAVAREKSARERARRKGIPYKEGKITRHIIFCGRPGTGKTTVAKALAHLFGACGLTSGADALVLDDPRHCSCQKIKEMIQLARGQNTLLLIDEAYTLTPEQAAALLNPMTEYSDLLIIFCVYPHELEAFKSTNAGLASRCDTYNIADYAPDVLLEIFERFCRREGYAFAPDVMGELSVLFRHWYSLREVNTDYANARDVEKLFLQMCTACDIRSDGTYTLSVCDIPAEHAATIKRIRHSAALETVLEEINRYVGLQFIADYITGLKNGQAVDRKFGVESDDCPVPHFLFTGPPGTGKTTAAELLAHALYALGLLKTPNFLKISARDLVAGYVGQTAEKTRTALNAGRYGCILIDEAYMLASDGMPGNSFREECVADILLFLEEQRGKTVVIFAGYEDEIQRLLKSNPGLPSRISGRMRFASYDTDDCMEILRRNLRETKYKLELSGEAEELCRAVIVQKQKCPDFANARTVRNLAAAITGRWKDRIAGVIGRDSAAEADALRVISAEDIPAQLE